MGEARTTKIDDATQGHNTFHRSRVRKASVVDDDPTPWG
jgi:hypothetical protein